MRLDRFILGKFDLRSRTFAENLILTGSVNVNGKTVVKPAFSVADGDVVEILDNDDFASQGAYKLEEAFKLFNLNIQNKICADIGCSNGGFTDCLLRHGAKKVFAVDVAECALPELLLDGGKVEFVRANARSLPADFPAAEFVCSDVSFISLRLVLPEILRIMANGSDAVVLVKPQFELDRAALGKSGIVKDEKLRLRALEGIKTFAVQSGFEILDTAVSPIRYQNKNIEYLLHLKKPL